MTLDAFLIAPCEPCNRQVLLAYDLRDGELITACVHCDHEISGENARPATPSELDELGYILPTDEAPHGGGGCRDGQCGVVQPDP